MEAERISNMSEENETSEGILYQLRVTEFETSETLMMRKSSIPFPQWQKGDIFGIDQDDEGREIVGVRVVFSVQTSIRNFQPIALFETILCLRLATVDDATANHLPVEQDSY